MRERGWKKGIKYYETRRGCGKRGELDAKQGKRNKV